MLVTMFPCQHAPDTLSMHSFVLRPMPFLVAQKNIYCKQRNAGWGPGNEANQCTLSDQSATLITRNNRHGQQHVTVTINYKNKKNIENVGIADQQKA